jgi:hypothetical protein
VKIVEKREEKREEVNSYTYLCETAPCVTAAGAGRRSGARHRPSYGFHKDVSLL